MKNIRKIIILLIIVFIILLTITIVYLKNLKSSDNNIGTNELSNSQNNIDKTDASKDENKITEKQFFVVNMCVTQYINTINVNNSVYYGYENGYNRVQLIDPSEGILSVLSKSYITENNLTKENLTKKMDVLNETANFVTKNMKIVSNSKVDKCLVYGILTNINNEYVKDMYLFVNLDQNNKTFSVEPVDNNLFEDVEKADFKNEESSIEVNDYNIYVETDINDENICRDYLNRFKNFSLSRPDIMFSYFDEEYAQKRFGTLEEFSNYIANNRDEIIGLRCEKYLVNNEEGYTQYVVQDQYNNYYIFNAKSIMDFTVELDTYTIPTKKFSTTYSSSSNEKKVQMNIDKFFKIINRHDYKTAYGCLATSFKNNYTLTGRKFIEVVQNKFFKYNNVQYVKCEEVGNNIYAYEIKLTDLTGENQEERTITIIMKLNDDENFEMSFDIE